MHTKIDWGKLQIIYDRCQNNAVGFELSYHESDDSFSISICSCAKDERFTSKCRDFDSVISYITEWLDRMEMNIKLKL